MRNPQKILLQLFLGYTAVTGTTVFLLSFCSSMHSLDVFPTALVDFSRRVDGFYLALAVSISCLIFSEYMLQVHSDFIRDNPWTALFCVTWMGLSFLSLFEKANYHYRLHPSSIMVWFNSLFVFSIYLARFQRFFSNRSVFYQWLLGLVFLWPAAYGVIDNWNSEWGPPATDAGFLAERMALCAVPLFFVIPGLFSPRRSKILSPIVGLLILFSFICFTNRTTMMFLTSWKRNSQSTWSWIDDPQIPVLIGVMAIYPALVILTAALIAWLLSRWRIWKTVDSNAESVQPSLD